MKILKLYSDRKKFKQVEFNEDGISVIIGADTKKINDQSTLNGTGKTLILVLIDFCLGSNQYDFLKPLDCTFYLDIKIDNVIYTLSRDTSNQDIVKIDNIPYDGITNFKNKLIDLLDFKQENRITLRSLLPYFLRYRKSAYLSPVDPGDKSKEDSWNHILTYLLGFDTKYSNNKQEFKKQLDDLNKFKNAIEDAQIKKLLSRNKDIKFEVNKLLKELKELENKQENFKIADNLGDLQKDLGKKRETLREINKKIAIHDNRIGRIEKSLDDEITIDYDSIVNVYKETKDIFNEKVIKTLSDVYDFQKLLVVKRNERLRNDLQELKFIYKELVSERTPIEQSIDEIYKIINTHGSFSELTIINKKIVELNQQVSKLTKFQELSEENKTRIVEIRSQLAKDDLEAEKYLNSQKELKEKINAYFSNVIEFLYGESGAGQITIVNNTKKTVMSRFSFDTKVYRDGSDGIGNMKIFAFGLLLLYMRNSPYEFLIFDNKIFYGVDANQSAGILKYITKSHFKEQIILCINQSDYDAILYKLSNTNEINIITSKVKLELSGDEEGTLLGEYIDLRINNI